MTEAITTTEREESTRGLSKTLEGYVVSNKMDSTVIVEVSTKVKHPAYGKYVNRSKRYPSHDVDNKCGEGDLVRIVQCRPLSKTKRWRVQEILIKAV